MDDGEWITGCTVIQCTPGTKAETINAYPDQSTYVIDLGPGFTRAIITVCVPPPDTYLCWVQREISVLKSQLKNHERAHAKQELLSQC